MNSSPVTVNIVQIKWTNFLKKMLYICAGYRAEYMAEASIRANGKNLRVRGISYQDSERAAQGTGSQCKTAAGSA